MESFRRIAIVGVGLIGGSIGMASKARGLAETIVGIDPDAGSWPEALSLGAADEMTADLAAGVAGADLVILAIPVERIVALLPRLAPLLARNAIVTDVGSVKGAIAATGREALGDRFVAGHPMAGSEQGGVRAARADLFDGATWALTPAEDADRQTLAQLAAFVASLGASPLLLSPREHDEAVALTSHVPHVIAYALCAMAGKRRSAGNTELQRLAAGSWASATRVAESSPALWAGITAQNRDAVAASLDECIEALRAVADLLRRSADAAPLYDIYAPGHAAKLAERKR